MGIEWNVLLLVAILTYALHFVYQETLETAAIKTELSCETNKTSRSHHAVLHLFAGKYYVQAINYNNFTIRLVDAGVHKIKDNYFSNPVYPLTSFNFSKGYYNNIDNPYTIYYRYFESPYASYLTLTVPLVFLSCTNPMNFSDLFVETSPCIGSHSSSSSDSSLSTELYSYFMLGRLSTDDVSPDIMSPADLEESCKITVMAMVSPPSMDKNSKSCEHLAYGFELSWLPGACTEKCGSEDTCAVNHNNSGIECYVPIIGRPEILNYLKECLTMPLNMILWSTDLNNSGPAKCKLKRSSTIHTPL